MVPPRSTLPGLPSPDFHERAGQPGCDESKLPEMKSFLQWAPAT